MFCFLMILCMVRSNVLVFAGNLFMISNKSKYVYFPSISLKERLTIDNLQAIIQQIRERIETSPDISELLPTFVLCKYMMPCIQTSQEVM